MAESQKTKENIKKILAELEGLERETKHFLDGNHRAEYAVELRRLEERINFYIPKIKELLNS